MAEKSSNREYRSLFWPMILVGVGVIWLLANLGIFTAANLAVAFRLWPLLLIVAGLDLLFGRKSPTLGAVIGLGTVAVFVGLMLAGPSLGLVRVPELQTTTVTQSVDGAESYSVEIDAGVSDVQITSLGDSANLIDATINHYFDLETEIERDDDSPVEIHIDEEEGTVFNMGFFGDLFGVNDEEDPTAWTIGLNPFVPLALDLNGGVGSMNVDLTDFTLTDVRLNIGVGEMTLMLPEPTDTSYEVELDGGVGSTIIELPDGAAVRIAAQSGVGSVNIDGNFQRIDTDDDFVGVDGVWETSGFDDAESTITIEYNGGVGDLRVR